MAGSRTATRVKRSALDEPGDEQTALVMNDLRCEAAEAGGLVANHLVAPVDSQERQFLADPDKIRLAAGANREVVIRKPARDSLDREGTANQTELAQPLDQLSLRATAPAGKLKPLDAQSTLPVDLELRPEPRLPGLGAINIE